MYCKNCGNKLKTEDVFCGGCGAKKSVNPKNEEVSKEKIEDKEQGNNINTETIVKPVGKKQFTIYNTQNVSEFTSSKCNIEINGNILEVTQRKYLGSFLPLRKIEYRLMIKNLASIEIKKKTHKIQFLSAVLIGLIGIAGASFLLMALSIVLFLTSKYKRILLTDNSRKKYKVRCDNQAQAEEIVECISDYINQAM